MENIEINKEQLETKIKQLQNELMLLNESLIIEKAIKKFKINDLKNNLLTDVKIIEIEQLSMNKKYLLMFKLNNNEHKIEFENQLLLKNLIIDKLTQQIFNELIKKF